MKQVTGIALVFVVAFTFAIGMALLVQNGFLPFWGAIGVAAIVWVLVMVLIPKKKTR
jgi:lipopolysaccharide export LptBFGC system permease protein LptF